MTGPGELSFTASAMANIKGEIRIRIRVARTRSLDCLSRPAGPRKGVSHTEITGSPHTVSVRPWIRSVTNMSGTKYTDAVVSFNESSRSLMRGCEAMGSDR